MLQEPYNRNMENFVPSVQPDDGGNYDMIMVRYGYLPFKAFFDINGEITLWLIDETKINTGLKRDDFPSCDTAKFSNYDPKNGVLPDMFIVLLPDEKLKDLGFEVKTGEGWKWDPNTFKSIKVNRSEKHEQAWCPVTESWEKPCECEHCQKKGQDAKYVNFEIVNKLYKSLPYFPRKDIKFSFAELANQCPFDPLHNCQECGASFVCEMSCPLRSSWDSDLE